MRVLSISSDRKTFDPRSASALRQIAYGERLGSLDIIVFSLRREGHTPTVLSQNVHAHPTSSRSRLFYIIDAIRLAKRITRPDVVTVQDPFEAGVAGRFIARRFNAPLHVQVHTDFLSPAFAKLSSLNRIRVMLAGFVLRRAARIRVVSNRIKQSIHGKYKVDMPISVLPIFVDIEKFRNAQAEGLSARFTRFDSKLLVVSRLEHEKNIELAIENFAKAAPQNTCLIIVGDGSRGKDLEKLAMSRNIQGRIFFEGRQSPESYYALADLVLFPSHYDGYGSVIIEALAAGKPVLATDVGIAREAGAIVTTQERFRDALAAWFKDGPRTGELKNYPYKNFDTYVQTYCDDIKTCTKV